MKKLLLLFLLLLCVPMCAQSQSTTSVLAGRFISSSALLSGACSVKNTVRYDNTTNKVMVCNGTIWVDYSPLTSASSPTFTNITFTGLLKAPNGNAAAPAYSFTSDVTTGLFSLGSGRFDISISGVAFADFAANGGYPGLVLYGASSPGVSTAPFIIANLSTNAKMSQWVDQVGKVGYIQAWEAGVGYSYVLNLQPLGGTVKIGSYVVPNVRTGTAAPAVTPDFIGQLFVDTTGKKLYVATGTASSADFTILN